MVGALIEVKSVLLTLRQIYFLRCSPLKRIVVFDLEADLFLAVLSFLVKSIFLDLEARVLFPLVAGALICVKSVL